LELNKRDFQRASRAIDSIYAEIVSQVGQPDNTKRSQTCSRTYQEFSGYGPPNCDVDIEFTYGVASLSGANKIYKSIQYIVTHDSLKSVSPLSSKITRTLISDKYYSEAQDNYVFNSLNCTSKYVYDTPQDTFLTLKTNKDLKSLYVVLGCSGAARQQYYPLAS